MTFVVTDNCIEFKYTDCVELCPVDCFYEGENMLVIHPGECVDCGVCEPECPAKAIFPDSISGNESWLELNDDARKFGPTSQSSAVSLVDADAFDGIAGKHELHFSTIAGQGN